MSVAVDMPRAAIHVPPGFPLRTYLSKLNHSGLQISSQYRRAICRTDPLAWALVYFPSHLRSPETGNEISLSEFHIALAESAKQWIRDDLGPAEIREAWVAPRSSGKSTWLFLILPLWAMAYGHRPFILAFAHAGRQAQQHLLTLKRELDTNRLLREDFPKLCRPARRGSRSAQDTQDAYLADNGTALMARGIDAASLGVKVGSTRPSLILLDDCEPNESNYSADQKRKRLDTIRNALFPMNDRAIVMLAGTTVMTDSVVDNIVKRAQWAVEENFQCRHFKALITDPDGTQRSLWPRRWSLEYLKSIEGTRSFALNMQNEPVNPNGTYWQSSDFSYDSPTTIDKRVLAIDPAVSRKDTSDDSGLAVVGYSTVARKAVVEMAQGVRMSPPELRERVHQLCRANPTIRTVLVETNQGGDVWKSVLEPLPGGAVLVPFRSSVSKQERFAKVHDMYARGWVAHAKPLTDLEEQMCSFPRGARDDIADATCVALDWFLKDRPRPTMNLL